jgi:chemotaxis protein MotB
VFEAAKSARASAGTPAWVVTFADLMSLLMVFFVLLLSLSEMDVSKYKELAGSLKNAFGVQRDIDTREPPKGINVIAREFSPARPEPTQLNVIRQMTTSDVRVNLDLGKERRRPAPTAPEVDPPERQKSSPRAGPASTRTSGLSAVQLQELVVAKSLAAARLAEQIEAEERVMAVAAEPAADRDRGPLADAQAAQQRLQTLTRNAGLISDALDREIQAGLVDVETEGRKIIIRVQEKASFGSGHAELKAGFRPILARLGEILEGVEGKVIVAGHTDDVPIATERFRSNWELSAARAVSVAHEMMATTRIPPARFLVQGFAATEPVAPNDSAANRARNRRVEIIVQQGDDRQSSETITGDAAAASATTGDLPTAKPTPQTAPTNASKTALGIRAAGGH